MSVIELFGVSKRYTLGEQSPYKTVRESVMGAGKSLAKVFSLSGMASAEGSADLHCFWALRDVSLAVESGETVGLIGRNGAGKSTLLKILARVTTPTAGWGRLRGRVASLLEVGTGFHPELTGRENIFLNGSILGMPLRTIRQQLDEIVAFAGIARFIDTPVKRYSSGMFMRLAFAVAAHLESDILLVDEVLAVGDAEFQKKCLRRMDAISRGGRTIVFVSHSMAAVRQLCSRGVVMEAGGVAFDGRIDQAADFYLQRAHCGGERIWHEHRRPGNYAAAMTEIRIESDGKPAADVPIDKPIAVVVRYVVHESDLPVSVSVHVNSADGICVFATSNLPSMIEGVDPFAGKRLAAGHYESRLTIPALFLNEGLYSITPFLVLGASQVIAQEPDAITMHVVDTGVMRNEYAGTWIGVTRPRLPWHTQMLSEMTENG